MEKICEYCDNAYIPSRYKMAVQRFCSDPCSRAYWVEHPEERKQFAFICKNCGEEYRTGYSDRNQYCSRECAFTYKSINKKKRQLSKRKRKCCLICEKEIQNRGSVFCGDECKKESARRKAVEYGKKKHQPKTIFCKECGKEHTTKYGDKQQDYCSVKCSKKHNGRIGKGIRRGRIRNAGKVESIDPFDIFKRDRWCCQLCGSKTPRRLRGTCNNYAPELDHIIPLALGGTHTKSNVQCLCRRCNQDKGATVAGQLRML